MNGVLSDPSDHPLTPQGHLAHPGLRGTLLAIGMVSFVTSADVLEAADFI